MINAFYPGTARITNTFEKLARRTFPAFLPKKLFYRQPIYYMSNALTIVPTGTPVSFPSYSTALDFELEVGFVLSSHCWTPPLPRHGMPSAPSCCSTTSVRVTCSATR